MRRFVTYNIYVSKPKVKVTVRDKMSNHVSAIVQKSTKTNFLQLCREIKLNEKLHLSQNTPKFKVIFRGQKLSCF